MDQNIATYIPEAAQAQIHTLLNDKDLQINVKKARKTRHGDYRKLKNGGHQITVNASYNVIQWVFEKIHFYFLIHILMLKYYMSI